MHENYIERIFKFVTVHFWELETWKLFKECRQYGVGICLARLLPVQKHLSLALHITEISKCSSSQCIWDCYFSLILRNIRRY